MTRLIFGAEWALLPHKSHMSVRIARIDKVTAMFMIQNEIKKKKNLLWLLDKYLLVCIIIDEKFIKTPTATFFFIC